MMTLAVIFIGVSFYNAAFSHDEASNTSHTYYTIFFLFFVLSMTGVLLSAHLALLWVFIEATTLSSAYLIYYHKHGSSLEAAWKYVFICSIGIAMAFIGIILLTIGMGIVNSLFFDDLYRNAPLINSFWLKIAFVFILAGFGTKAGLAPVHAWLPDAHSEAPSPVSAMLSGTLLNTAVLGIIRVYKLMELSGTASYARVLMLVMGFLSVFVCAVYISRTKNYKRMLAYSSIENMGIVMIGISLGGIGVFAAFLHIVAHSLTKAGFFLTSGNIVSFYNSKLIKDVKFLYRKDKFSAWLWIFSFVGISGLPPFPLFISEFLIVKAFFDKGWILPAVIFLLLLTVILYGMGNNVLKMCFGRDNGEKEAKRLNPFQYIPQTAFFVILLIIGLLLPEPVRKMLQSAAALI
jgi:hydrogenase-4 component F